MHCLNPLGCGGVVAAAAGVHCVLFPVVIIMVLLLLLPVL